MKESRRLKKMFDEAWDFVEYCRDQLKKNNLEEADRIRWAGVLARAITVLNDVLQKAGWEETGEDDLASILSKIPSRYRKIAKRVLKGGLSNRGKIKED